MQNTGITFEGNTDRGMDKISTQQMLLQHVRQLAADVAEFKPEGIASLRRQSRELDHRANCRRRKIGNCGDRK